LTKRKAPTGPDRRWKKRTSPKGAMDQPLPFRFLPDPHRLPRAADRQAAQRGREALADTGSFGRLLLSEPTGVALADALFGNSPHLTALVLAEPEFLALWLAAGPDIAVDAALGALDATPSGSLAQGLRIAKRRAALAIALADLTEVWDVGRVTQALSRLADNALQRATRQALAEAALRGRIVLPADPERPGFVVLGMGKLGAHELNYSSDVDLILLYDPSLHQHDDAAQGFARVARELVSLMQERTADGYVFRTDLRLRPDPGSTPLVLSTEAALGYYETMGQNWERAAMIKARPVAGDLRLGEAFLTELRPYVWRRHLDFAAIEDIHAVRRQILAHRAAGSSPSRAGTAPPQSLLLGHDLKLGRGGIREIEFTVQTLQLIWGGRRPQVRVAGTIEGLRALSLGGMLPRRIASELAEAYRFLRRAEHRLQMIDDRQTHALPADPARFEAFAVFLGFDGAAAAAQALLRRLAMVERHYAKLFDDPGQAIPGEAQAERLLASHATAEPAEREWLSGLGFADPGHAASLVAGWASGRPRALRTERARGLLRPLLPLLLRAFGRQAVPDAALARFDAFLQGLPQGVQIFSLFQRNPELLDRIARVFGSAPALADFLARHPQVLEGLLEPPEATRRPEAGLHALLRHTRHYEESLDLLRRAVRERDFLIGVATLDQGLGVDEAAAARTRLADAALRLVLVRAMQEFQGRFGRIQGGNFAVLGLGKLGAGSMMAGSDLDLILVYDHPADAVSEGGGRSLPGLAYYGRFASALISAITAPMTEGRLYDLDTRLRPSGNQGPIAVSLDGFARYQRNDAWTWEHLALTRARVVAGPPHFRARVAVAVQDALRAPRDATRTVSDTLALRARIARDLAPQGPWDVKYLKGGLLELELLVASLQLVHAQRAPSVLRPRLADAIEALVQAGALGPEEGVDLARADRLFRAVQGMLRLTVERPRSAEMLAEPAAEALRGAAAMALLPGTRSEIDSQPLVAIDLATLRSTLSSTATRVHERFEHHLGRIAAPGELEA